MPDGDVVVYGVNQPGEYLGLVPPNMAYAVANGPPPALPGIWLWDIASQYWARQVELGEVLAEALRQVDALAGAARTRHLSDGAGQQATYLRKAEEARSYVAACGIGAVPPYVLAEAQATGVAPIDAAAAICAAAELWDTRTGPSIELARRRAKLALRTCASAPEIDATLSSARATLADL